MNKIMIVSEDKSKSQALAVFLTSLNLHVLNVWNAGIAIQRAKLFQPHVVLLDAKTSSIGDAGSIFIRTLKADEDTKSVAVICLNLNIDNTSEKALALAAGCRSCFGADFDKYQLYDVILDCMQIESHPGSI